ncbi:MAG: hypothetical protein RH949_09870 [Coleofasciculus sp. A1-SPW-01]
MIKSLLSAGFGSDTALGGVDVPVALQHWRSHSASLNFCNGIFPIYR